MFCSKCGSDNQDGDKYCVHCGRVLQQLDTDKLYADNPFGIEYNSNKSMDNIFSTNHNYNDKVPTNLIVSPVMAQGFVFYTSLIMGIVSFAIFFGWTLSSFYIFSGIIVEQGLFQLDVPTSFVIYKSLHIVGVLLSLIVCVSCNSIAILSKQHQQGSSNNKFYHIRVLYCVVIVCLIALITIASLVYACEYTITQQLLSQGWTARQITEILGLKVFNLEGIGSTILMINAVLIVVQYSWQFVFAIIGLIKVMKPKINN